MTTERLIILDRKSKRHNWQIIKHTNIDSEIDMLHAGLIVTAQIEQISNYAPWPPGAQVGMLVNKEYRGDYQYPKNTPVTILWEKE